jgi:hypothetical protein
MLNLIAYVIVGIALFYAAWLFMPAAARHWLIAWLVHVVPVSVGARLERLQNEVGAPGCSSCKGCETESKPDPMVKPVRLHRR